VETPSFRFSFDVGYKIWQVLADTVKPALILEVRNDDDQTITYHWLDANDGKEKRFAITGADWWTTLLRVHHPYLFLERYNDPQNPIDKDLLVYHLVKKRIDKEFKQFQLSGIQSGKLVGHLPEDRTQIIEYDLDINELEGKPIDDPLVYQPGTSGFKTIEEFLALDLPQIGIEYLEYKNYIIIGYYERLGTKFERKLLVMKGDAEIYHETVDTDLKGFASGSFFVFNNLLIFIHNSHQIHAIEL